VSPQIAEFHQEGCAFWKPRQETIYLRESAHI